MEKVGCDELEPFFVFFRIEHSRSLVYFALFRVEFGGGIVDSMLLFRVEFSGDIVDFRLLFVTKF